MIQIIDINDAGEIVHHRDVEEIVIKDERIFLRPDWPPIGSPDFAAKLRAWHEQHNPVPVTLEEVRIS